VLYQTQMARLGTLGTSRFPPGLWLIAAILACAERGAAAPAQGDQAAAAAAPSAAASAAAPGAGAGPSVVHVVQEGETLWDIARAYGASVDAILQASGMGSKNERRLSKGTRLTIPGATKTVDVLLAKQRAAQPQELPPLRDGAYHRLQRGETVWDVARMYDVSFARLMERNKLTDDGVAKLQIGHALIVPGIKQSDVKDGAGAKKAARGFTHEILPGETVWDIARRYRVSVAEIMSANRMSAEQVSNVRDGTRIFLPGVEDDGKGRGQRRKSGRELRAERVARGLGLGTLRTAAALLHGRIEARWIRAASEAGRFNGTLRWPVAEGWFVRGYGSGAGGYHKAMDIAGKIGWNVRAAAPGIVGYSGDQVPGFGNMVMIVHPGGWVTLYAHNSVNFVAAGERVDRGTVIAEVGSTGRSQGPHVHFELIHRNHNCDPAPLFRPGVRKRTGALMRYDYTSWKSPDKRPGPVRCARRQKHPQTQWVIHENPTRDVSPEAEHAPETAAAPPEEP
jgi:murein DD-endopeptidase MepM/ murein hydrolase activator NlpD